MSGSRRRYSFEDRSPEQYIPFNHRRRTVILETTTVRRRHRERIHRSPSPTPRQRRRSPSLSPSRQTTLTDLLDRDITMSPTDKTSRKPHVELPPPLPKEDNKKKSPREKPKVTGHKKSSSYDTGYGSGFGSPYDDVEDRTPDQYSPLPLGYSGQPDTVRYEVIDGKTRRVTYFSKNGKQYRHISSKLGDDYVQDPGRASKNRDEKYKTKYLDTKERTKALQDVIEDTSETAKYNYEAAKREEAARKQADSRIEELEARLRGLALQAQVAEGRAAEAERRLKQKEAQEELDGLYGRREKALVDRQWEEILSSPIPRSRKPQLPPLVTQDDKKRRSTAVATTGYGQSAMTTTTRPSGTLALTNPMDAILEAQADYDRGVRSNRNREEDRRYASDVKEGYTSRTNRQSRGFYE